MKSTASRRKVIEYFSRCEGEVVSEGERFIVKRSIWLGRAVFIKLSVRRQIPMALKRFVQGGLWASEAENEANTLRVLQRLGFYTARVMFSASQSVLGLPMRGVMVTEAIIGEPLDEAMNRAQQQGDRVSAERLTLAYAELIAGLHAAGAYEPLRAKDVFVCESGLRLIDREKPVSGKLASDAKRERSLKRMQKRNGRSGLQIGEFEALFFQHYRQALRDSVSKAKTLVLLPEDNTGDWEILRQNARYDIRRHRESPWIYKARIAPPFAERCKSVFRGNSSERIVQGSELLRDIGLRAPRVLQHGLVKSDAGRGDNYVIMERIQGSGLHDVLRVLAATYGHDADYVSWRNRLATSLGLQIGLMHLNGVVHGDLRPNNILLRASEGMAEFVFIDNERSRKSGSQRERVRNLVQLQLMHDLVFSPADRNAFFAAYAEAAFIPDLRVLRAQVDALLQQRLRKIRLSPEYDGAPMAPLDFRQIGFV